VSIATDGRGFSGSWPYVYSLILCIILFCCVARACFSSSFTRYVTAVCVQTSLSSDVGSIYGWHSCLLHYVRWWYRSGLWVEIICANRFLAGCRKRRILAASFPEFLLLRVALFSVSTWTCFILSAIRGNIWAVNNDLRFQLKLLHSGRPIGFTLVTVRVGCF